MSDVVTGEAVALELRRASVPTRMLAGGIDLAFQFTVFLVALTGVRAVGLSSGANGVAIVLVVLVVLAFFVYPVALETLTRGRTLGKMALGLRAVRVDGGPITFRQALVRGLLAALLEKPGLLLGLTVWIGVLTMMLTTDSRRLGDLAAGTMVIRDRVPRTQVRGDVVAMPPLAGWAALLDLAGLDDGLALSARQYLSRIAELSPGAAETLGRQLAEAVAAVTSPPPPVGTPAWAYLSAVLAERRRRAVPMPAAPSPTFDEGSAADPGGGYFAAAGPARQPDPPPPPAPSTPPAAPSPSPAAPSATGSGGFAPPR